LGLTRAHQAPHIESKERVMARDAKIVQTTGNPHHPIRNALGSETQDIFDNPTAFDARYGMFHHHTHRGDEPIQEAVT
jgi:hypothetical protein